MEKKGVLRLGIALVSLLAFVQIHGQNQLEVQFDWTIAPQNIQIGENEYQYHSFEGSVASSKHPTLPVKILKMPVSGKGSLKVDIVSAQFEPFSFETTQSDESALSNTINFSTDIYQSRDQYAGTISFIPIIKTTTGFQRLTNLVIQTSFTPSPRTALRSPDDVTESALSNGQIYKIAVKETGIQKLSYSFLKDDLGINIDQIDPRKISVLGNRGGILPYDLEEKVAEDIPEIPIQIVGESDGSFDAADFLLFYGEGADKWEFNANSGIFNMQKNIYDQSNYYFIKVGADDGLRLTNAESASNPTFTSNTFNDFARFEEDRVNLLYQWGQETSKSQGSGQNWYGERFKNQTSVSYDGLFDFPGLIRSENVDVKARMALRSLSATSFNLVVNGSNLASGRASSVNTLSGRGDNEISYAHHAILDEKVSINDEKIDITVNYNAAGSNNGSEGWLDYIQVNVKRQLRLYEAQTDFRDLETLNHTISQFEIESSNAEAIIWDISDPLSPKLQQHDFNSNTLRFITNTTTLKEFIVFDPSQNLLTPEAIGNIPNQNLHGIDNIDLLVIYHPDFTDAVQRFADHRSNFSGFDIALVTIDEVMNEFAAGAKDPTAIRNFARLLFERNSQFKYLLLFGDGSFDARDVYTIGRDYIPTFQSDSTNPIFAFPSDDYFSILSENKANDPLDGMVDIGVGRLPAETIEEANVLIDKIIHYDTKPTTYDSWRNQLLFIGDDEDGNLHLRDVDRIANSVDQNNNTFNLEKVYIDAFPQVSTPGGARFPEVNEAINRAMFKGVLAVTYLGHGGPSGWAQERILNISDIQSWTNIDNMPIFITATCTFGGYDDVTFKTAGERVILNPNGGAISLLTTTRAVFATANASLTQLTIDKLFFNKTQSGVRLGDAMKNAKNDINSSLTLENSRKFTLLGDPSQKIAIPKYDVQLTKINGNEISLSKTDTIRALEQVTIEGIVVDGNGNQLTSFNGLLFPTIYDKKTVNTTLGQDTRSPQADFIVQTNVLFKGRSTVTNGAFKFSFVVPKDINFDYGNGKISIYASDPDQLVDASGANEEIVIGGVNENGISDNEGPNVEVYMNTEDFVFGGTTNRNPVLLVLLEDDNGINVVGNSIGHDLEGTLDEDTQNTLLLNDFYESNLDDFTKGIVRFPLQNLEIGRHNIRVKAWDVANNSSEGYTEFVVAETEELALENILNYPNPFTDQTCFQFDHNAPGQELEVQIQIFTISGRLVKTIDHIGITDGALRRDDCISWNGRDDFGDRLARGVYLYRVKVRTTGSEIISQESEFEKLVILK